MISRARRWLRLLASLLLIAAIFYFVPLPTVFTELAGANWLWVVLGLVIALAANGLAALQMQYVLDAQDHRLSWRGILAVNFITKFYGLFLPSYLSGGAIRWYHFSRPDGRRAESLAAIVFNRQLEIAVMLALGLMFLGQGQIGNTSNWSGTLLSAVAPFVLLGHLLVLLRPLQDLMRRLVSSLNLPNAIGSRVLKVLDAYATYGNHGLRFHGLLTTLCISRQLIGVVTLWIFANALHIGISPIDVGWVRSALDIALMFPISLGGIGVREASLAVLLGSLGVPSAAAIALGLLLLLRTLIFASLGGLIELWRINSASGLFATEK